MPLLRQCLTQGCRLLTPKSRCPEHERAYWRQRGSTAARGYAGGWPKRAREQITREPWCVDCGTGRDLTADHLVPGDPDSPLVTRCRGHNSARANRMRATG